jgi:hypothetical protein
VLLAHHPVWGVHHRQDREGGRETRQRETRQADSLVGEDHGGRWWFIPLDAAARVLAETGQAMNCQELITAMAEKGYWTSPGGKTPAATLYSAILRELQTKGNDARFKKTERGKFEAVNSKSAMLDPLRPRGPAITGPFVVGGLIGLLQISELHPSWLTS